MENNWKIKEWQLPKNIYFFIERCEKESTEITHIDKVISSL
jgi:hypothetical protein